MKAGEGFTVAGGSSLFCDEFIRQAAAASRHDRQLFASRPAGPSTETGRESAEFSLACGDRKRSLQIAQVQAIDPIARFALRLFSTH
jgi:hypothetical protein